MEAEASSACMRGGVRCAICNAIPAIALGRLDGQGRRDHVMGATPHRNAVKGGGPSSVAIHTIFKIHRLPTGYLYQL